MAVIGSDARTHKFKCEYSFMKDARLGVVTQFTHPVREGTYPRSGFQHPRYAVGDILDFIFEKKGLVLFNKEARFEITAIELGKEKITNQWLWTVEFKKLELG